MVRIAIFLTLLGVAYVCHAQRRPVRGKTDPILQTCNHISLIFLEGRRFHLSLQNLIFVYSPTY